MDERQEWYGSVTVGDVRYAVRKVREFLEGKSAVDSGFSPEDVVAVVVDAVAENRELLEMEKRMPSYVR